MTDARPHLDSEQRHTLERLTGHPLNHNIKWPEVLALLEALGEVSVDGDDRHRVTVAGHTEVFRPPRHHGDVPTEMVVKLRRFLASPAAETEPVRPGRDLLVVADHHSATVWEFEPPIERVDTVLPFDPRGRLRHLHHAEGHYQGQRAPEDPGYYRAIAEKVRGADTVLVFGHGDGHSAAARLLAERLRGHLAGTRILAEARVDAKSFTEPELLAAARQLLAEAGPGGQPR